MLKINLDRQTIYKMINVAFDQEKSFDDIKLTIEYVPVVLRILSRYIPDEDAKSLHSKYAANDPDKSFMLVAKIKTSGSENISAEDIAYSATRKFNHAVSWGGDQVHIEPKDIVYVADIHTSKNGDVKYALIPFEG